MYAPMLTPDTLWQVATKNMTQAIGLCSLEAGRSPEFAIELLRESAATFAELLPQKPRMLQQTLGEFLSSAVHARRPDAVSTLLSLDAYVDWRAEDSLTPLHVAAEDNQPALITMLASGGADLEMRTGDHGRTEGTAVHIAITRRNLPALLALVSVGADVNAVESERSGDMTLHCAAKLADFREDHKEALFLEATRLVQALISAGADVMVRNRWGELPLTVAIEHGNTSAGMALLGARTYPADHLCQPLRAAISTDNHAIIEAAVDAGANLSHRFAASDGSVQTPLDLAEYLGNAGTIELVRSLTSQTIVARAVSPEPSAAASKYRAPTASGPL